MTDARKKNEPQKKQGAHGATGARQAKSAGDKRDTGEPGGGQGRRDVVGGSKVYPMSGTEHPTDARLQGMASWGQGERGADGYNDSGGSELVMEHGEVVGGLTSGPDGRPTIDIHAGRAEELPAGGGGGHGTGTGGAQAPGRDQPSGASMNADAARREANESQTGQQSASAAGRLGEQAGMPPKSGPEHGRSGARGPKYTDHADERKGSR